GLLDGARDALAVARSEDQRAQDEQVQRALQQIQPVGGLAGRGHGSLLSGRASTRACAPSGRMSTRRLVRIPRIIRIPRLVRAPRIARHARRARGPPIARVSGLSREQPREALLVEDADAELL